ncbi:MAG: hypothetical protein GPOALKHO_000045 [Sodalis sp.]|nr:MAG: hypothetical protein GPOALKHO_000045 [Sodalis sp.]
MRTQTFILASCRPYIDRLGDVWCGQLYGITVGDYVTFTNVKEEYEEGSFTKGFHLSIPLDVLTVTPNRTRAQFNWTLFTRDGGQMVEILSYGLTDERSPAVE